MTHFCMWVVEEKDDYRRHLLVDLFFQNVRPSFVFFIRVNIGRPKRQNLYLNPILKQVREINLFTRTVFTQHFYDFKDASPDNTFQRILYINRENLYLAQSFFQKRPKDPTYISVFSFDADNKLTLQFYIGILHNTRFKLVLPGVQSSSFCNI